MACAAWRRAFHGALIVGLVTGAMTARLSASEADAKLLNEQIAAGEFSSAIELANRQADRATRDRWLAQVATAQRNAGASQASLSTMAQVRDDRYRSEALNEMQSAPVGQQGAGVVPDFDSLITLLKETIAPQSWADTGGTGAVKEFRGGVSVDTRGMMRKLDTDKSKTLASARSGAKTGSATRLQSPSNLRKVSLTRLEREIQLRVAAGKPIDDAMMLLAGIQRIEYLFIYPDTGDLVIAGPADGWRTDVEGRMVGNESGRPVVRLEDLVVMLRHLDASQAGRFGCSITPSQESLARTQEFVAASSKTPLKPGKAARETWLAKLRDTLGPQDITVSGIDPRTRVARVLVEADYRMKLVGIGLEPGTADVPSYLDMIRVAPGQAPPALDVLRWWFTMNYDAVQCDAARESYGWRGQGVRVQCENELLDDEGQRVHTDQANQWNREFAHNFTKHFNALAAKYPIYAELQNVFDLALVATIVKQEKLDQRIDWHAVTFRDPKQVAVSMEPAPRNVQTVLNHRVVNQKDILAAISGGVSAEPTEIADTLKTERDGQLDSRHKYIVPAKVENRQWWWD
ncbi:MAG: DUF1598 domain-containing protein [Planctomycetes bacterium]|nr:DUF1598 domain-containing protein [Planctomycetota bacterium]